jgi:ferredoxin
VKELDLSQFEQTLDVGDKLVVVEFYSNNCAFCAAVAPIYEALSREMGDEAVAIVIADPVPPETEATCREAAGNCPVESITIEEG